MEIQNYWKSKRSNWVKWVLLFPALILANIVISPIIKIMCDFVYQWDEEGWLHYYFIAFLAGYTTGLFTIYIVYSIAPISKNSIMLLTLILMSVFNGFSLFYFQDRYYKTGYNTSTETISTIVGCLMAYSTLRTKKPIQPHTMKNIIKSTLFAIFYVLFLLLATYSLYHFTLLLISLEDSALTSMSKTLFWTLYLTIGFVSLYFVYLAYLRTMSFILKKIIVNMFVDTKLLIWITNSFIHYISLFFIYLIWFGNSEKLTAFGIVVSIIGTIVGIHMCRTFDEKTKNLIVELKYFINGMISYEKIFDELRNEL